MHYKQEQGSCCVVTDSGAESSDVLAKITHPYSAAVQNLINDFRASYVVPKGAQASGIMSVKGEEAMKRRAD
jgi:hypothetical protein